MNTWHQADSMSRLRAGTSGDYTNEVIQMNESMNLGGLKAVSEIESLGKDVADIRKAQAEASKEEAHA